MKVFLDLGWFFKQRKKQYLVGILMLLFVAFLQLLPPKIIGYVVDEISQRTLTSAVLLKWLVVEMQQTLTLESQLDTAFFFV